MPLSSGIHIYNKKYIELLESVQKFACKVCLKCWDMDYQNMLHCLDTPLSVRRRYLKLITMFNIVNGQSFFPPGIFEPQSPSYNLPGADPGLTVGGA